nr:FAD/NAD(P)-binding protein [Paracoccus haematequi]
MTARRAVAIIGTGPTGIYSLKHLLSAGLPLDVTLYERGPRAGIGMPYSPETANKSMLANIASIEIPPVVSTYLEWLEAQPSARLASYGLDTEDLDDRQFTPRLLLGEYFRDQLLDLVQDARAAGHRIAIRENTEVLDIGAGEEGLTTTTLAVRDGPFDQVIVATGHQFPDTDEATQTYFPSPWSGLIETAIPAVRVGIMGTSLSSIDAAMAVVNQHGRFRSRNGALRFDLDPASSDLEVILMSRTGVLPEADFYCPIPYEPLTFVTGPALTACLKAANPLDAVFDLIKAEITQADPAFALRLGLKALTADSFTDAYFASRETSDPFEWACSRWSMPMCATAKPTTSSTMTCASRASLPAPRVRPQRRSRISGTNKTRSFHPKSTGKTPASTWPSPRSPTLATTAHMGSVSRAA